MEAALPAIGATRRYRTLLLLQHDRRRKVRPDRKDKCRSADLRNRACRFAGTAMNSRSTLMLGRAR